MGERKIIQRANEVILSDWALGDYAQPIRECHERLSAVDPGYAIIKIQVSYTPGGDNAILDYWFEPTRAVTLTEVGIMEASVQIAQDEIAAIWNGLMTAATLDADSRYEMDCD